MMQSSSGAPSVADSLPKNAPVLFVLVRQGGHYKIGRRWGIFDSLGVRAIDDLVYAEQESSKTLLVFTEEPPHSSDARVVSLPAQVALERAFFHIQGISSVIINPRSPVSGCALQQEGLDFSVPESFSEELRISRGEIPEILGAYSLPQRKVVDLLERGERAFYDNSLFEALCLARRARRGQRSDSERAWFIELMSMSFLGLAEEALVAYEECPLRGATEPEAQLLAARFRLLLKQFNEARTILHTLTFHERLGALAACELARSYLVSGDFDRAIDTASTAIDKDPKFYESYLVRGIAQRGLSYSAGEEGELRDALKDFERVAQHGGFSAPEALFHAGTVFGRLGALEEAEIALRQSLFQRDRFSSRDALVRVLCASGKLVGAQEELDILKSLAPAGVSDLEREVESHIRSTHDSDTATDTKSLWSAQREAAVESATKSLTEWRLPIRSSLDDFAILDDFINRYAPAGDFMSAGEFAHLGEVGVSAVGRAMALHLGALLVRAGLASWEEQEGEKISILSQRGMRLALESFVQERLVLGASGDNFTSLESMVAEVHGIGSRVASAALPQWWRAASAEEIKDFGEQAEWARAKLIALGADLHGDLRDFDDIDRVIEHSFEPGGGIQEVAKPILGDEVERFVVGVGLVVGGIVAQFTKATWYTHELPEGFSLVVEDMGRIFPVARIQRRVFLSSAVDTSGKLGSFAFGVAAAVISERIREGVYHDRPHVVTAFKELLPQVREFSDTELEGVAEALFERGRSGS